MIRYVERDSENKIMSSFEQPQPPKRLNQIDDQSEEYKEWVEKQIDAN